MWSRFSQIMNEVGIDNLVYTAQTSFNPICNQSLAPTRWLNMTKWLKSVDLSDSEDAVLSLAYDKIVPEEKGVGIGSELMGVRSKCIYTFTHSPSLQKSEELIQASNVSESVGKFCKIRVTSQCNNL